MSKTYTSSTELPVLEHGDVVGFAVNGDVLYGVVTRKNDLWFLLFPRTSNNAVLVHVLGRDYRTVLAAEFPELRCGSWPESPSAEYLTLVVRRVLLACEGKRPVIPEIGAVYTTRGGQRATLRAYFPWAELNRQLIWQVGDLPKMFGTTTTGWFLGKGEVHPHDIPDLTERATPGRKPEVGMIIRNPTFDDGCEGVITGLDPLRIKYPMGIEVHGVLAPSYEVRWPWETEFVLVKTN